MTPSFKDYLGNGRYEAGHRHAYPATTCISLDDEVGPRHPRRPRDPRRAGRVGRRRRDPRGLACRRGADVDRRRGAGRAAHARRRPRRAPCWPASRPRCRAITWATSRRAIEDVAPRAATASSGRSSGHGIGTEMHQDPQVPELPHPRRGIEARAGPVPGHRADAHPGHRRCRRDRRCAGRSPPVTAASPRISSTPSPSPTRPSKS